MPSIHKRHILPKQFFFLLLTVFIAALLFTACGEKKQEGPLRDSVPLVLTPEASGTQVFSNELVTLDASNTSEGYLMLLYSGTSEKVQLIITDPAGTDYVYALAQGAQYHTFPLTSGSGSYRVVLYENIPDAARDDLYSVVFTQPVEVESADEFKPFLYPNQYVNFTAESKTIALGEELAQNTYSDLDVVANVYNYVIKNISYDEELAQTVSFGYVPNVDHTLETKKGICFDYASVMAAMLRAERIPTKLEVGYSGDALHAWISTYIQDVGWVGNVIEFDGTDWKLMDPTLAASNDSKDVKKYIGDGSNYQVQYSY